MLDPQKSRPAIHLDSDAHALLTRWVTEHWDGVYGLAYRLCHNRHEADDLTQESFLKAAMRRETYVAGTNLRAWLLRIVTNCFLDGRRRKRSSGIESPPDDVAAPLASPTETMANAELGAALSAAIAELPETARAVFLLRTQEEMPFREIAETIGAGEETARWHMMQARRGLMKRLGGWI
jgi:RNA polymerase sigma-70 factor (ECF subfamily)